MRSFGHGRTWITRVVAFHVVFITIIWRHSDQVSSSTFSRNSPRGNAVPRLKSGQPAIAAHEVVMVELRGKNQGLLHEQGSADRQIFLTVQLLATSPALLTSENAEPRSRHLFAVAAALPSNFSLEFQIPHTVVNGRSFSRASANFSCHFQ
uniref:Uncharacterized protein n=1 Tax=Rhipicephalus microplus TaxID=6941 RepID=A0A6G5A2G3_RHIMP